MIRSFIVGDYLTYARNSIEAIGNIYPLVACVRGETHRYKNSEWAVVTDWTIKVNGEPIEVPVVHGKDIE